MAVPDGGTDVPTATRPGLVIAVLVSAGFTVSLMTTLVIPLLPRFPELLDTSYSNVTWLVTGSLIAGAVATPMVTRLADLYGKRRLLLVSLGLMTLGSALGAVAPGLGVLIVARVLQGASVGVIAIGMGAMRDLLPPRKLIGGVALMSSSLGFGGAIGLPLTGIVAQFADWRWLFGGTAVLGAGLVAATLLVVPESAQRAPGRFDLRGGALLAVVLLCLLLGISKGTEWGWSSGRVLGLFLATCLLAPVWGWLSLRSPSPLIDLRVAARRSVMLTNAVAFLVSFGLYVGFLVTPQILQADARTGYGLALPAAVAGLALIPFGATMTLFSPVSAAVTRRFGPHVTLIAGGAVLALGCLGMVPLPGAVVLIVACSAVSAIGTSLAFSAIPILVMSGVPATETAAANGVNSLVRMLGSLGCSAFAAAVASTLTVTVGRRTVPSSGALVLTFVVAAVAAALATALAAVLLRTSRHRRATVVDAAVQPAAAPGVAPLAAG
jgi:predicted MFS family arabinose efflux permease